MNEKPEEKNVSLFTRTKDRFKNYFHLVIGKTVESSNKEAQAKARKLLLLRLSYFSAAFLFSNAELLFSTYPLSLAFCVASSGNLAIFAFTGGILGSLFLKEAMLPELICLFLALAGRLLLRYAPGSRGLFKEPLIVRCALSVSLAFILSLYDLVASSFAFDSLYALLFTLFSVPFALILFTFATEKTYKPILKDVGLCSILFFVIYSLGGIRFFGFSFAAIISVFIILSIASTKSPLRASITGALCGLAIGTVYAPTLCAFGLASGLLADKNMVRSVSFSSGIAIVMAFYFQGYSAIFGFIGDIVISSVIFLPLYRIGIIPEFAFFESAERENFARTSEDKRKYEKSRLSALSCAFDEISDELLIISEREKKPGEQDYRELCENVCALRCPSCKNNKNCWSDSFSETSEALDKVASLLYEKGAVSKEDLPVYLNEKCPYSEEMILDINVEAADMTEKAVKKNKTETFALDYEALGELLGLAAKDTDGELKQDIGLCNSATKVLRSLGISALGYSAKGSRMKTITVPGIAVGSLNKSGKEIREAIEKETGILFSDPQFDFQGEVVTMVMTSREKICSESFFKIKPKEENSECGDNIGIFSKDGKDCLVISDGMGSGKIASVTSKISEVFIEKMVSAGNRSDVVLKMLSNFIRSKSDECSCAIDLAEIDRYTGRILFTKCGTAPSFIIRGDKIFRIEARSMPIGVTRTIDPEVMEIEIFDGDYIVMMSDGAEEALDDPSILSEAFPDRSVNPENALDFLYEKAIMSKDDDDITIAVIKINGCSK